MLLNLRPNGVFLEMIRWFPLVYWMKGSIKNLEDLLKAGINDAKCLTILIKQKHNSEEEQSLVDCNTILTAQYIFRYFYN